MALFDSFETGLVPLHGSLLSVDSAKEMVGTFSPQLEPYTHEMPEETTPTGFFARGSYTAKTKVNSTHALYQTDVSIGFTDLRLLSFFHL